MYKQSLDVYRKVYWVQSVVSYIESTICSLSNLHLMHKNE